MIDISFSSLKGKVLRSVEVMNNDEITFTVNDNEIYTMHHHQNCCERVYIHEIVGDLQDLVGTEILHAEERCKVDDFSEDDKLLEECLQKWTFYSLRTIKGSVDISWFGSSNGYYSVEVSFERKEVFSYS